jgi:hypothetical protein
LETGGLIHISESFFELCRQFVGFGAVVGKQALIDVQHFATDLLHWSVNQVAGEGPIALIDERCQVWETLLSLRESLCLPADHSHVFWANRCGLGIAITAAGCEAEAEAHAEAKRSEATQGAQHGDR